ncbi:MAG: hypothetical protein KGJ32_01675 [Xanthomonadaceae bacterium]|nr:hypothetical protein [Xanthomonadaceae bacterium]
MKPFVMRKLVAQKYDQRWLCQMVVAIVAMGLSGLAGAAGTTIKAIVGRDSLACQQFLAMVKAAGIPDMSDAQLCDFRFARLPVFKANHFTAIDWRPLEVKDPLEMYRHMRMANVQGPPANDGPPWPDLMKAVAEAKADHNLGFRTAQVQLQGKGPEVTVVEMDVIRNCSKLPKYMLHVGVPYYAIYKNVALQHPLRFWIPHESWQMMLWSHNGLQVPVLLGLQSSWSPPIPQAKLVAYLNTVTLDTLVPNKAATGKFHDTVSNYGSCAYDLWSKTKPNGTTVSL